jgi:hypothetical protein
MTSNPFSININNMTVQQLIVALQNLVESNPSLANAGVTRRITVTETVNVSNIEVFESSGCVRLT